MAYQDINNQVDREPEPVCRACGSHDLSPARGTCLSCSTPINEEDEEGEA